MLTFRFISIGSNLASLIQENKHVILMSLNYYKHIQPNMNTYIMEVSRICQCQKQVTYMYHDDYNILNKQKLT